MFVKPTNFPKNKKILYCCLYWGLGHATRSQPIINELLKDNNAVTIASDGLALDYLKVEFPNLSFIELQPYNVTYPTSNFIWNMMVNSYSIYNAIEKENAQVKQLTLVNNYDVIISDNRPGCHNKKCQNIFITHQLFPVHKNKLVQELFYRLHRFYYKKFDELWIPDAENINLAGKLSKSSSMPENSHFVGILSRLSKSEKNSKLHISVLLSGPEPQRTIMENSVYEVMMKSSIGKIIFVRGTNSDNPKIISTDKIEVINVAHFKELEAILQSSELVITRSGYTTLLDLYIMGLDAVLVPTPGQTEQEYLAEIHSDKWPILQQKDIEKSLIYKIKYIRQKHYIQ